MLYKLLCCALAKAYVKSPVQPFRANLVPPLHAVEALVTLSEAWSESVHWQVTLAVCALALTASSGCSQQLLLVFEALPAFYCLKRILALNAAA